MTGAAESTETVPQALGHLREALDGAFTRASRELGLTAQQAQLICAAMEPAAIGDLAGALRCDRSNVSRLVDRASDRGLLKRRAGDEDGRITVIELTPEGERMARRFFAALEAQTEALRAGWSGSRHHLAIEILNELSATLDASQAPPKHRRKRPASKRTGD